MLHVNQPQNGLRFKRENLVVGNVANCLIQLIPQNRTKEAVGMPWRKIHSAG